MLGQCQGLVRPLIPRRRLQAPPGEPPGSTSAQPLEQDPPSRKGWFRLTNPGATGPTGLVYLLRIDCAAKTLHPVAQRKQDAAGAISDQRDYGPDEDGPLPIENGTVMEIAYLALCT
jgi:hypothetical protein